MLYTYCLTQLASKTNLYTLVPSISSCVILKLKTVEMSDKGCSIVFVNGEKYNIQELKETVQSNIIRKFRFKYLEGKA